MITKRFREFLRCHKGAVNKILHIIGFAMIGLGLLQKSFFLLIGGAIVQELGHFYQYAKTRDIKDSPFYCFKPQALFAYPVFTLMLGYVYFAR